MVIFQGYLKQKRWLGLDAYHNMALGSATVVILTIPFFNISFVNRSGGKLLFKALRDLQEYGKRVRELADIPAIRAEEEGRAEKRMENRIAILKNRSDGWQKDCGDLRKDKANLKARIEELTTTIKVLSGMVWV